MNELLIHFGKIDFDFSIRKTEYASITNYFIIIWKGIELEVRVTNTLKGVVNLNFHNEPNSSLPNRVFFEDSLDNPEMVVELYNRLDYIYKLTNKVYCSVRNIIDPSNIKLESEQETKDRLEEFDVIKDNKLDLISLNSLFDYYGKEFNEQDYII